MPDRYSAVIKGPVRGSIAAAQEDWDYIIGLVRAENPILADALAIPVVRYEEVGKGQPDAVEWNQMKTRNLPGTRRA